MKEILWIGVAVLAAIYVDRMTGLSAKTSQLLLSSGTVAQQ